MRLNCTARGVALQALCSRGRRTWSPMNDASSSPELMRAGEPPAGGVPAVISLSHRRQRLTASRVAAHAAALQEGLRLYQAMFERSALGQLIMSISRRFASTS
jgi:hypothetical protein